MLYTSILYFQTTRKKEGLSHIDPRDDSVRRELLTDKFTILVSIIYPFYMFYNTT